MNIRQIFISISKLALKLVMIVIVAMIFNHFTKTSLMLASSGITYLRCFSQPVFNVMPFGWAKQLAQNIAISDKYNADVITLKQAGYIQKDMVVNVYAYTDSNIFSNRKDFANSWVNDHICIIFLGLSPNGKAYRLDGLEDSDGILTTHQVMHETSHCVINRDFIDLKGKEQSEERFADSYGLAMAAFVTRDLKTTLREGRRLAVERARGTRFKNEIYNTAPALIPMIHTIDDFGYPDPVKALDMALRFSDLK